MIDFPIAKINLGLHITGKLPDGYHSLETVFYPVPWCDILEVIVNSNDRIETSKIQLTVSGLPVEGGLEKNLCYRAYQMMDDAFSLPAVSVFLHKQIPMGAGLGGGSSDAACMLKLLNNLFDLKLNNTELARKAVKLGADCAFFLNSQPCYATGKGDQLSQCNVDLSGNHLVIVKPPVHISTADAFSKITPRIPAVPIHEMISSAKENWKSNLKNDFEDVVFAEHPEVKEIKNMFYQKGAWYASMSGSGSAVYGLFSEAPPEINVGNYQTWSTRLP